MPSVPREKYPEMNWRAADKVAAWKIFKRRMEVIFVADQIPEERQWALILVAGGDEGYNCWDTLEDTVTDSKVVKQVWDAFEKSLEQSTSFWHFRDTYLADFRQDKSETTAALDLCIKQTVRGCQWEREHEEERMIDLLYHATIYYEICKFVQESNLTVLTYEMVIEKAKAHERNILEYKDHQASHGAANSAPWIEKLKDSTQRDPILVTVYQLTQQGWPHQRRHVPRLARRYWDFRDELSTDDGMLLKGPRLIILGELQEEYLSRLHEGHLSANKVQENAKHHMYWTGIDADIEDYTKRCQECIKKSQVPKEPLLPHDIPEGPWKKLGIDYFTFDGNSYVLICDYFSKFPFLYRAKTSFWSLRDCLIDLFSIEGYPDEIVSDNGPPFQSKEFAKFLSGLGIKHTTSSPGYSRSNGFIERHIQTVKNMLSKSSNTQSF